MNWLADIDLSLFHAINDYCGRSWALDHFLGSLQGNNLISGGLYLASFWALWLQPTDGQARREMLITLLFAVVLSLILNRLLSIIVPFRVRPMYELGIGFRAPLYDEPPRYDLEGWSAFPSDHATFYFALTTGFWLLSRRLGMIFAVFSILWGTLPRVYFGVHYPSDVLVGALIGIGVTIALERPRVRNLVASPVLALKERAPTCFSFLMFLLTFETANLFANLRRIGKGIVHLLQHQHYW
jgi:undecaprenyl-diphosphatase